MPLPFTDRISSAKLRGTDSITFDPLGVAAVLQNPRADLSAARLYVQNDRNAFRWPHTTMIGGALTPLATLVAHLAQYDSIHPAVSMCTRDEKSISVLSNTVIRDLRINVSNIWLRDVLNFKPSKEPFQTRSTGHKFGKAGNDFAILWVKHVFDQSDIPRAKLNGFSMRWRKAVINLTGLVTGLLLSVAFCFSVLTGDIWGIALFFLYLSHWAASTCISFTYLVRPTCPEIRADETVNFLVHERPVDIGGTVVFKGYQHELETWARTTLQFRRFLLANILHWFWVTTGTLSAISSVACMVNMTGTFQLVFLAVLVYSSLAELWLTQCSRRMQRELRESAGLGTVAILRENKTRTEAVIRATIGVADDCSLKGLDWVGLKLLPPTPIFVQFQDMLGHLVAEKGADLDRVLGDFRSSCLHPGINPKDVTLVDRIIDEVRAVVDAKSEERRKHVRPSHQQQNGNGA